MERILGVIKTYREDSQARGNHYDQTSLHPPQYQTHS